MFVQRTETSEYVDIGSLVCSIRGHPKLRQIAHPACSLVALYVLSGCDYTSSFYGCTKQRFLDTFLDNISYICAQPSGSLVTNTEGTFTIPENTWIRLITAVYFYKHSDFFRHKAISDVYNLLTQFPDAEEGRQFLSWVGYRSASVSTLEQWHEFMQRVTFHASSVTKVYEYKLLPTISALFLHLKRANYVLRMVCSSPQSSCSDLDNFSLFGWQRNGTDIQIEWDSSHPTQHSTTKCTCTTGCSSGRCSCFKNCSACTAKCRCSRCNNPHNDGNHCSKCSSNDTDESESEESGNEISNNELDDIYMSSGDEL